VQYGKRLKRVESNGRTATAYFEDGLSEEGNLLVGAEGAHSKVHQYLLGPEKTALQMSPLVASIAMPKLPAETALKFKETAPRNILGLHPNGHFALVCGQFATFY
jgi:2-polyprenyl-6-methoxyphenol hydroxylase-like FAD-dependent oxidoreductase